MNMKYLKNENLFWNRYKNGFLYLVLVVSLLYCSKPDIVEREAGIRTETIKIDGIDRRFAFYAPEHIGVANVPLIFELHGGGIYIEDMTGESGYKTPYKLWMNLAEVEKFIIVYPEGLNGAYGKPTWNDCRGDCSVYSNADDVKFIGILIDWFKTNYNIDENRIYISGTSNGGFMALRLAVESGDKIAAVAAVAAGMPAKSKCGTPSNPVSVLFMNGTDDNHLPYNGGYVSNPPSPLHGSVLPTDSSVSFWVRFNKTDTIPTVTTFDDLDGSDGGIVEKYSYKHGKNGTEVILYKINGGGHSAPSIKERYSKLYEQYFNHQNHDIEMTTEVWEFFKDKVLIK